MTTRAELERLFPGLRGSKYRRMSPESVAYNCVAWAGAGEFQATSVIYSASRIEIRGALQWMHFILTAKGIPRKACKEMGDEIWRLRAAPGMSLHLYAFSDDELPTERGPMQSVILAGADLLGSHGQRTTRGLEAALEIHNDYLDARILNNIEIDKGPEPIGGKHVH